MTLMPHPHHPRFGGRARPEGRGGGFTMVESVIVLGIIVLVASLLLVGFPSLTQRINLQRASQRLALSLRKAQNMALAVRQVERLDGSRTVPPAFGISLELASPASYRIFADLQPRDGLYDSDDDIIMETVTLEPGITLQKLVSDLGGGEVERAALNITFTVPEAGMEIRSTDTGTVGESAEIVLITRDGAARNVVVRTSGQIHVQR